MVTEKYVSPIKDELDKDMEQIGEGILLHHDKKTKHLLIDVDISERRKISSTGITMILASASHKIQGKGNQTMNLSVWDKDFTKEELPKVRDFLEIKKQQADLKKQAKALQ